MTTAQSIASFLSQKDAIIASPITNTQAFKESRAKRSIPKFQEDEEQFCASISTIYNMSVESSDSLKNFLEYGPHYH